MLLAVCIVFHIAYSVSRKRETKMFFVISSTKLGRFLIKVDTSFPE